MSKLYSSTHSFQMVVQMSFMVTPAGFLMIVHHGVYSVMMMISETRGSVAGSSLLVKGRSLSRASALNPVVWPVAYIPYVIQRQSRKVGPSRTSIQVEQQLEPCITVGQDGVQLEVGVQQV